LRSDSLWDRICRSIELVSSRTGRRARLGVLRGLVAAAALALPSLVTTAAQAAELVMFDGKWCGRCKQFLAEVAPVYHTTPPGKAMPLRVVDVSTRPWFRMAAAVEGTPTFVLVDNGAERGRIVGYTTREAFIAQAYALMGAIQSQRQPRSKPRVRDVHAAASGAIVR
jgi:hypothetical protein